MKKSQFIFAVTQALEEATKNSVKVFWVEYSGHVNKMSFAVAKSKEAYMHRVTSEDFIRLDWDSAEDAEKELARILRKISDIATIPDEPVEEMVTVQIPKSKAKEMGVA